MILLLALGCGGLAPSLDPTGDSMLAALPADVTVIGAVDVAALRGADPRVAQVAARMDTELLAPTGLAVDAFDRIRFGCGGDGCALLGEGRFDRPIALPPAEAGPARLAGPGFDIETGLGVLSVRRLDPTRLAAGDPAALHRMATAAEGEGLDPATLAMRVPDGDVWLLLRDPAALTEQAIARLLRSPEPRTDAAVELHAAWQAWGDQAGQIESVALALDVTDRMVRARAVCVDASACRGLVMRFEAWRALHPAQPAARGDVVVEGSVAEWTISVDALEGR